MTLTVETVTVEINGRTHTIDDSEPVGTGKEGVVRPMPDGRVIKLYKVPRQVYTPHGRFTLNKLSTMIEKPPKTNDKSGNKVLAWPQEIAIVTGKTPPELAGFTMPRVGGQGYLPIFEYYIPKRRKLIPALNGNREAIDEFLEGIITNLIYTVNGIHEQGYIMGDFNQQNILVGPNALINIIDCDSFQVTGHDETVYTCPVGKPEFSSPRLLAELKQTCTGPTCPQPGPQQRHQKSYSCVVRPMDDDRFALAVMLYLLLMEGCHPYKGAVGPNSSIQERILSRKPLCFTDPCQLPKGGREGEEGPRERWHKLNDTWKDYFRDSLTGTRYYEEDHIPPTDRIFRTEGFRSQVIVETEESAKPESTPSKKVLPVPDRQEAARIALRRAMIALMDSDRNGKAAARIELDRAMEAFPNSTEFSRELEAARKEYLEVSRAREAEREAERERVRKAEQEATQNKPSTPSNVCPNCKERFRQGEVYCQTRGCITQLQTRTKLCIGCGKHIPYTAAFCQHCRLKQ